MMWKGNWGLPNLKGLPVYINGDAVFALRRLPAVLCRHVGSAVDNGRALVRLMSRSGTDLPYRPPFEERCRPYQQPAAPFATELQEAEAATDPRDTSRP